MGLADELAKLDQLRRDGGLTGEEFAAAKYRLIEGAPSDSSGELDAAATEFFERRNRSNQYLAVWNVVVVIIIAIMVIIAIASATKSGDPNDSRDCTVDGTSSATCP